MTLEDFVKPGECKPLTIKEVKAALDRPVEYVPRCWDRETRAFRHVVSPRTLALLVSGELKHAPCVNCGRDVAA